MSIDGVRNRSLKLQEEARRRITLMCVAGAGNIGLPLALMWYLPHLRLAFTWLIATAVFLMLFVRRRCVLGTLAPSWTPAEGLTFYRRLLEHERDFRRGSVRWFTIGPALNILMLGLVHAVAGGTLDDSAPIEVRRFVGWSADRHWMPRSDAAGRA